MLPLPAVCVSPKGMGWAGRGLTHISWGKVREGRCKKPLERKENHWISIWYELSWTLLFLVYCKALSELIIKPGSSEV